VVAFEAWVEVDGEVGGRSAVDAGVGVELFALGAELLPAVLVAAGCVAVGCVSAGSAVGAARSFGAAAAVEAARG